MSTIEQAVQVVPSPRQIAWQKKEFYAFIHFGMNTFSDREWGDGTESPQQFCPAQLDAAQWVRAVKSAGMKALILTCKHHDGFCLWPSAYTQHSVKYSPWKNGAGDVVREVSDACRAQGLAFGVYLSPWDRNVSCYGDSDAYNVYYKNQLRELAQNYGEIFCFWFDGACGEGANGKRQQYDWEGYYEIIRTLQPNATINVCGPDVRWCGNEAGQGRKSEWSVVPAALRDANVTAALSQQTDDASFARKIDQMDENLGGRDVIAQADSLVWYPAEVDTSIRPGWFYHAAEDAAVRSLDELMDIYYGSVGANACLLLNIPPNQDGLLAYADVRRLAELGARLQHIFVDEKACKARVTCTAQEEPHVAAHVLSPDETLYWRTPDGVTAADITLHWDAPQTISHVVLQEHLPLSQRVEAFSVFADDAEVYTGTVIGYKRIARFSPVKAQTLTVRISESRLCTALQNLLVY